MPYLNSRLVSVNQPMQLLLEVNVLTLFHFLNVLTPHTFVFTVQPTQGMLTTGFNMIFELCAQILDWGTKDLLFKTQFPLFVLERSAVMAKQRQPPPASAYQPPTFAQADISLGPPFGGCDQAFPDRSRATWTRSCVCEEDRIRTIRGGGGGWGGGGCLGLD